MWGLLSCFDRMKHNEAYYNELEGMEREYKMAEKEAKMREPIMSGLTAIEAAAMIMRDLPYGDSNFGAPVLLVRSLEKLGIIKFKEEQIITYAGKPLNALSNEELVDYTRIEYAKSFTSYGTTNYDLLFKEMSRRLGENTK